MKNFFYENFSFIGGLIICIISAIRTMNGTGNTIMRQYGKLIDSEKERYDISKVKKSQLIFILSFVIVITLNFIFKEIFPNSISPNVFTVCYLVVIVVLCIFMYTKWILNRFCKK